MPPRKRLGQLLTELGVVDEHQLQSALGHQKQWGGKLGSILVQKGFCSEPAIISALAKHLAMPMVSLATTKVDARAVKFVSKQVAEKLHVFPYEVSGSGRSEVVTVAMSDPTDLAAVDQLAFHTGKRIKPMLAGDSEILTAISQHYGGAEEKKVPTDKMAQPTAATPAPPHAEAFPRRFEPQPPGSATPSFSPPPPAQAPPAPEALDLPESEDDGQGAMLGLEPIAAHTQVEQIAGEQELAGEGSAADPIEGLETAGVRHEGVDQANAASWASPAPNGEQQWGEPAQPAADAGWGAEPAAPATAWAEPEGGVAWGDEGGAGGWDEPSGPTQAAGDAATQQEEEAAAPAGWTAPIDIARPPAAEATAAVEANEAADAPDEWSAASDDPLAAAGSAPADASAEAPGQGWNETPAAAAGDWGEPSAPSDWSAGTPAAPTPHGVAEEEGAQAEAAAEPEMAAQAEGAAEPEAAEEAPQSSEAAALDSSDEEEFEIAQEPLEEPAPPEPPPPSDATDRFAAAEASGAASSEPAGSLSEEEPGAETPEAGFPEEAAPSFAIELENGSPDQSAEPPPAEPPSELSAEQGEANPEGWVAPRSEEPQQWAGQGVEPNAPLSPADEGTLASVGVHPSDGVAALRTLAALVRVLQRRQLLDPDELAAELRAGFEYGAQEQTGPAASPEEIPSQAESMAQQESPPPQDLEGSSGTQPT